MMEYLTLTSPHRKIFLLFPPSQSNLQQAEDATIILMFSFNLREVTSPCFRLIHSTLLSAIKGVEYGYWYGFKQRDGFTRVRSAREVVLG